MRQVLICLILMAGLGVYGARVAAADFYVDPVAGSPSGDGSAGAPWQSLQQVIDDGLIESQGWPSLPADDTMALVAKNAGAPVQGGDTIWLMGGDYGALNLTGYYNAIPITVQSVDGQEARFTSLLIRVGASWAGEWKQLVGPDCGPNQRN